MRLLFFGTLDAHEPKIATTIVAIEGELKSGDLIYQYPIEDGLHEKEGASPSAPFGLPAISPF